MSVSDKANGDQMDLTTDKTLISAPKPQRKPKINRRGFHLSNNPLVDLLSDRHHSNINGSNDGSENKNKTDVPQRRVISLSSVKNSLTEKQTIKGKEANTITLKRSNLNKMEIAETTEMSSSSDPPKKKHKPITWP